MKNNLLGQCFHRCYLTLVSSSYYIIYTLIVDLLFGPYGREVAEHQIISTTAAERCNKLRKMSATCKITSVAS